MPDEAVFWIGFLAIISRSTLGHNYIRNNLEGLRFSLIDLANIKYYMFSPIAQRLRWPSWFGISSNTQGQSNAILHKLYRHIVEIQFTNDAEEPHDYGYPDVTEVDELTLCRKHEIQHKEMLGKIVMALSEAIDDLMKLRQGWGLG
ncbi:hypothetical protein FGG08_006240 [Glutinoglossum americanum]|uniref:Uncharacterized protein n=1 Tax=Glutinoglossum americanum TaxID=1670608 RepID=A0A9P8I3W5_9PEZI|nr:hypothetical protein FGG08_006240 [Glutinoglossum americanum]